MIFKLYSGADQIKSEELPYSAVPDLRVVRYFRYLNSTQIGASEGDSSTLIVLFCFRHYGKP